MNAGALTLEASPDPTRGGEAAYIPLRYHTDFIDLIADHAELFQVLTYQDLPWRQGEPASVGYPGERLAWETALDKQDIDPSKIYVLIQHDVDTQPDRTVQLLKYEASRGVRSNVMIFNKRVNRRKLAATGVLEYTSYDLDFALFKELEKQGFVFGYHSNAYERALYDLALGQEIFREDIEALSAHLNIRYFSAHGGTPGPNGLNNRDLALPAGLESELIWVHNGATPWFAGNYSDGGINSPLRDPAKRDLRDFVIGWCRGSRYRVLTHPQYYDDPSDRSPRLSGTRWYEEVRAAYESGEDGVWDDVLEGMCRASRPAVSTAMERIGRRVLRKIRSVIHAQPASK